MPGIWEVVIRGIPDGEGVPLGTDGAEGCGYEVPRALVVGAAGCVGSLCGWYSPCRGTLYLTRARGEVTHTPADGISCLLYTSDAADE